MRRSSIIGDVICHGKKQFWTAGGSYHYHHGMAAGENTLDTILCRLLLDSMVKVREGGANKGIVDVDRMVDRYVQSGASYPSQGFEDNVLGSSPG